MTSQTTRLLSSFPSFFYNPNVFWTWRYKVNRVTIVRHDVFVYPFQAWIQWQWRQCANIRVLRESPSKLYPTRCFADLAAMLSLSQPIINFKIWQSTNSLYIYINAGLAYPHTCISNDMRFITVNLYTPNGSQICTFHMFVSFIQIIWTCPQNIYLCDVCMYEV